MYNSQHILAINKLIILLLIREVGFPLSSSYIIDFITVNSYADYFSVQNYIAQLCESNLLETSEGNNSTYYKLTQEGLKILNLFLDEIPSYIREKVIIYIEQNKDELKNKCKFNAEYYPKKTNNFLVKCSIEQNNCTIMRININATSEQEANIICTNWQNNASHLYTSIFKLLTMKSQL